MNSANRDKVCLMGPFRAECGPTSKNMLVAARESTDAVISSSKTMQRVAEPDRGNQVFRPVGCAEARFLPLPGHRREESYANPWLR